MNKIIITVLLCVLSYSAFAADGSYQRQEPKGWKVSVGAITFYAPSYRGSSDYSVKGFPNVSAKYKDIFFMDFSKGIGVNLIRTQPWKLSFSLGYSKQEDGNKVDHLAYVENVAEGAVVRADLSYQLFFVRFNYRYKRQVTGQNSGSESKLSVASRYPIAKGLFVAGNISAVYSDNDNVDTYFDISPKEARLNAIDSYNPNAGFSKTGVGVNLIYNFAQHWNALLLTSYTQFVGDAKDSPMLEDTHGYSIAVAINYTISED